MKMRISHRTGFTYDGGAAASYNEARMTPIINADQVVLQTDLDVTPSVWSFRFVDYWATIVTAFELHERHEDLTVVATSTVTVDRDEPAPDALTWADLADSDRRDRFVEMLTMSRWVEPGADLHERIADARVDAATPGDFVRAVAGLLHSQVRYLPGSTEVSTTAAEAWDARSGVCQDFAHLTIGCLRAHGIPARYVSGYLHPQPDPQIGETVRGESHAWVEWWDGAWKGLDPTNAIVPGDRHVVVGHGRTYADCPPLRGVFSTRGESQMFVDVEITRLA